jgi:2-(1,2-epoxy-1,2-dihydrophenyl)acetyl-CoA isomerase
MTEEALILVVDTLTEKGAVVRTLTFNRPASLNSFTAKMNIQLRVALSDAAADEKVRCIVITGAGRGFCAGQDLNDPEMGGDVGAVVEKMYKPLALQIRNLPVPVIAAVNGVAAGAGANIALGCDMVLATQSASFIQAFSKIALIPDAGGTWLLPRLIGRARAIGLAMTGDKLSADDAEKIGLIWRSVPDAEFASAVAVLAARLAVMPSAALAATRQAIDDAMGMGFEAALSNEAVVQGLVAAKADFAEGVAAFRERRAARFGDR